MPAYPYFSCSRIQTFRKCPKAFEFSYVLEIAEEFQTIEKHMGSAVHELFEWLYQRKGDGCRPDAVQIRTRYDEIWNGLDTVAARIVRKETTVMDYYRQGLDMALAYWERVIAHDDSQSLHLEHQFDLDLGQAVVYRGIIDRVSRSADGTLRLTDYKTGRTVPDPRTDLQLRSYTLAMFELYADPAVEICYEDLRQGRSALLTVQRSQTAAIRAELLQAVQDILSATVFGAVPSSLCDWCGHLPHCPEGKKHIDALEFAAQNNLCPRCGAQLLKRNGRFGPFLSCANFPACRFSRNIASGQGA